MKKLISIAALSLMVLGLGFSKAQAIPVIDGYLNPPEWDNYFFNATDPNENGDEVGEPNIPDNYDISLMRFWWDDTYAYIRTDVYGTPSFVKIDSTLSDFVYYQWNADTTGDGSADLYIKLRSDDVDGSGNGILRVYDTSWTQLVTGTASVHNIVEGKFNTTGSAFHPYDEPVSMYMALENVGGSADDRLPNTGWTHITPEPSSMLLFGMGILGLFGLRKKV